MKKIKIFLILLIIVSFISAGFSKAKSQQVSSKNFVYIKPQFEDVMFWANGLISYLQNDRWGFLDSSGSFLSKPEFDRIEPLVFIGASIMGSSNKIYKDFLVVWKEQKAGIVDSNAKVVVQPDLDSFDVLNSWLNLLVCKKDNKYGFLNLDTKAYAFPQFDKIYFVAASSYNPNTKYTTPHVKLSLPDENKQEFCLYAVDFKEGIWTHTYLKYILASKDGKYGAVDISGNVFVDFKYSSFEEVLSDSKFAEALSNLLKEENNSNTSNNAQTVAYNQYVTIEKTEKGYVLCFEKETKRGLSSTKSKEYFENAKYLIVNKLVAVCKNKKWAVIDSSGKYVVKPLFDDIKEFSEGMCAFKQNGKWGFMDKNFKIVIKPQFDRAENFSEGLAAVAKSNLWGYINYSGKFVIKPQYIKVGSFFAQMAPVSTKDYVGLIDTKGNLIVKFSAKNSQYSFVDSQTYRFRFSSAYLKESTEFLIYQHHFTFPKFGYVIVDKKSNKVGLVLRKGAVQ